MGVNVLLRRHCWGLIVMLFWISQSVDSHIVLTYPPARKYPIDGLTPAVHRRPCGVPKGLGPVTEFKAGETVRVTFHVAYPHQGGYSINLLNNKYELVQNFTNGIVYETDPVREFHDITLPVTPCSGCTLQALRETREKPNVCGAYRMSCADINIVADYSNDTRCMGHGEYNEAQQQCMCDTLYSGDRCQYKDDCVDDEHCNSHGECIDIESTFHPKKQCFCDQGWFGRMCEKKSTVDHLPMDMYDYTHVELSNKFDLYYRHLWYHMEVEFVLKVRTISWVALGWRPKEFKSGCLLFPKLNWTVEAAYPTPDSSSTRLGDETVSSTASCGVVTTGTSDTTGGSVHDMGCTDVVMGAARGMRSRIADYYTRENSSPLLDELFGGTQSLSGAVGEESGGITTILFRKKMMATERTDHGFTNKDMHVIWAFGQSTGNNVLPSGSGMTAPGNTPSDPNFYKTDELTYHGYDAQRGTNELNFNVGEKPDFYVKEKSSAGITVTEWIIIGVVIAATIILLVFAIYTFCTGEK